MASRTWPRSVVGCTTSRASVEKATSPMRNAAGRLSTKPVAAALAAASRVGSTSVAVIERETSIVSITVASSRGTWSVIDGRARATTRNVIAPRYRAVGTCRRQPGVRGTRFVSRSTLVNRTTYRERRRWTRM